MRQRIHFIAPIIFLALSSAVAMPQQDREADSVQNDSQGITKSAGAARTQSFPRPNWDVRYKSGSFKLKKGQWLKASFAPTETSHKLPSPDSTISVEELCKTSKQIAPFLMIMQDQLRAVYFNSKAEKDSDLMQRMPRSGCHYAQSLMPKEDGAPESQVLIAWLVSPRRISRGLEHLNHRSPVQLVWTDGPSQNEIVFTINDCEYAFILGEFAAIRRTEMAGNQPRIEASVMNRGLVWS